MLSTHGQSKTPAQSLKQTGQTVRLSRGDDLGTLGQAQSRDQERNVGEGGEMK
jgi:hypothetical protein